MKIIPMKTLNIDLVYSYELRYDIINVIHINDQYKHIKYNKLMLIHYILMIIS